MQKVKATAEYTIYKKRSGRHAILDKAEKFVRGEEKTKILLAEKLIKQSQPKAKDAEAPAA